MRVPARVLVGLILALAIAVAPAMAGLTLARVDGVPITLDDLQRAFERQHQGHMPILADEAVVGDFLEAMIRRELFTQEGRRMRIHELPEIVRRVTAERDRIAAEWLYRTEVEQAVQLDESLVREAMERMRITFEVILVQTDSRDEAEQARRRIAAGESAEAVARELSRARSAGRGGLEGLAWGQTEMPALERAALELEPGGITEVVPVENGFCVAKVVHREVGELPDPAAARRIAETVLRRRTLADLREAFLDSLRGRYAVEIDESLLEPEVLEPLLAEPTPSDERILARYEGGTVRLDEFVAGIDAGRFAELRPAQRRLQARQLLDNRLDAIVLRLEGRARWALAPPSVKTELIESEDDLVFRHLMGQVVFDDLAVEEAAIEEYYAQHGDEFVEPEAVLLAIALLDDETSARTFLEEAGTTERFAELAANRSKDEATAKRGGVAGWVTPDQAIPQLRGPAFEVAAGSNGGPLRLDEGFLVLRVLERRDVTPMPEAKARAEIHTLLMKQASKERMDDWETRLREAATIKVFDGAVKKAARRLLREQESRNANGVTR